MNCLEDGSPKSPIRSNLHCTRGRLSDVKARSAPRHTLKRRRTPLRYTYQEVAKIVLCGLSRIARGTRRRLRTNADLGVNGRFRALPAPVARNRVFLPWASKRSCEDCPVWGEFSKGHPAKVAFSSSVNLTSEKELYICWHEM